ncbi:MAG: hypothetical protein WD157_01900 [Patescibacteria group bacterium]
MKEVAPYLLILAGIALLLFCCYRLVATTGFKHPRTRIQQRIVPDNIPVFNLGIGISAVFTFVFALITFG